MDYQQWSCVLIITNPRSPNYGSIMATTLYLTSVSKHFTQLWITTDGQQRAKERNNKGKIEGGSIDYCVMSHNQNGILFYLSF